MSGRGGFRGWPAAGLLAALLLGGLFLARPLGAETGRLRLATTTSTENSGLLGVLLPAFEKETGLKVDVIAVGTGKALRLAENGDVDVVLVHDPELERKFVADGFGVERRAVMHNDFIIVGPAADPAHVRGDSSAAGALAKIAAAELPFVSRGDESGTHAKEKALWARAGLAPSGAWYKEAGQGMGAVLVMAGDLGGYTLTDRGTYLAMKAKLALEILVEGDPALFNPYGVIAVNPQRQPHVNFAGAMRFITWITSEEGQRTIAGFKVGDETLFTPDALPRSP